MRILLVEDESEIVKPVRNALEREGHLVMVAETGADALRLVSEWRPETILLDLMLPDRDGRDVAREIRRSSSAPIIMVTARGEEADRVAGLDSGADDYIVKPYSLPELLARIRAVARRSQATGVDRQRQLCHADLMLDLDCHRVCQGDRELRLSPLELEILRMLMERGGAVVTRMDLASVLWGRSAPDAANILDVHVSTLRQKLGDDARRPSYIETIRGVGFRLVTG